MNKEIVGAAGAKGGAAAPMKHEATQNQGRRALLLSTPIVSMAVFGAAFGTVVAAPPAAAEPPA
ncbi:MAG: hypothetical protein RLN99_05440, partial [Kiloniellaceae bacterium]